MTAFTKKGFIRVNSIGIPPQFVAVASRWYSGMGDMLYAVCSTGGLTTGTNCPVTDYTGDSDRNRKWYLTLWRELSCDVGCAESAARKMAEGHTDPEDCEEIEICEDAEVLADFEEWLDSNIIPRLEESYGLGDWENE